jgi:cation diffusion facilitator family transporter
MATTQQPQRIRRAAILVIATNSLLVLGKLAVAFSTGAVSILSEAAHSGVDLLVAILAYGAIRYAQRPADRTHPYGHGKVETLTGLGEGLLVYAVAGLIVWQAIVALIGGPEVSHVDLGIVVMVIAAAVNVAVSRYLLHMARLTGSPTLEATGTELGTDVITAFGVSIGLILVRIGGWHFVDPLIGLIVAVVIIAAGTRILIAAVRGLMDYRLPDEEEGTIRGVLDEHADAFIEYHDLRARHVGSAHEVNLHLVVPRDMSVADAHDLSTHLEDEIADALPQTDVVIHVEPDDESARSHASGHETISRKSADRAHEVHPESESGA